MNEDIVVPGLFFFTVIVLSLGIPLVRSFTRSRERMPSASGLSPELAMRLDRLEAMVETIAVEVERMAEGQRFTTKLLAEGAIQPVVPQMRSAAPAQTSNTEVTHA